MEKGVEGERERGQRSSFWKHAERGGLHFWLSGFYALNQIFTSDGEWGHSPGGFGSEARLLMPPV